MKVKAKVRPLYEIAAEIRKDWKTVNSSYAEPYFTAMSSLDSINDTYIMDSANEIVLKFLSNASTWRGETARHVKKELNSMTK